MGRAILVTILAVASTFVMSVSAWAIPANIADSDLALDGRITVVTGKTAQAASFCGTTYEVVHVVAIDPFGGPAIVADIGVVANAVKPGDRFDLLVLQPCGSDPSRYIADLSPTSNIPAQAFAASIAESEQPQLAGRIVAVTRKGTQTATFCSNTYEVVQVVAIDPTSGPAVVTEIGVVPDAVKAGDRFVLVIDDPCLIRPDRVNVTLVPVVE